MNRILLGAAAAAIATLAQTTTVDIAANAQSDPFNDPKFRNAPAPTFKPGELQKDLDKNAQKWRERREWYLDYEKNPSKYKTVQDLETREPNIDHIDRVQMAVAAEDAARGGGGTYLIHGRLEGKATVRSRDKDCALVNTPINAAKAWVWRVCTGKSQTGREIIMRAAARAAVTGQPQRITVSGDSGTLTFVDYVPVMNGKCPRFKIVDDKRGPLQLGQDWICVEPSG